MSTIHSERHLFTFFLGPRVDCAIDGVFWERPCLICADDIVLRGLHDLGSGCVDMGIDAKFDSTVDDVQSPLC